MDQPKRIIIISDSTGKTAKRLMDSVLAHYSQEEVNYELINTYAQIRDREALDKIIAGLDDNNLVIYSIISEGLSLYLHERLSEKSILHLNILRPMLITMSKFFGVEPDYEPGILQKIDDRYYKKVDAIGYTVQHDDGCGPWTEQPEVVLVGLSRTCKTPISMYLACNFGVKVANIPVVPNDTMVENLLAKISSVKHECIFGLTMRPDVLAHVREERSAFMSEKRVAKAELLSYFTLEDVRAEVKFCRRLFDRMNWPTIDVTRRAIEEISLDIMHRRGLINGK